MKDYDSERREYIFREIDRYADDYALMIDEAGRACVDIGCSIFIEGIAKEDRGLEDALWEYYVRQQDE